MNAVDIGGLENEVYDHLYSFFRRYYSEGDFLAKRVYRPGVYAIPYEGEEVKLHWANRDQYYIKTSEYLRDYAFRLKPDDAAKPMRVHFRLVDAAEGEHGNIKAAEGKDRVFILAPTDFIAEEDGDLVLRFVYRPATLTDWPESEREGKKKPPAQKDLTSSAVKKKFVVETNYCITLDRIPEEFYPEIAASDAQREEWVRLFAINEIEGDLIAPAYSNPLTVPFLKANPHLLVDTRFFEGAFKDRLFATIDPVDAKIDGTLIHSDNFQALQLVRSRMREQVKCVYIDPPYNTASSSIPYKNNYKHSSFASMMFDRIASLHPLLPDNGAIYVSIDKAERTVLEHMLDDVFGRENRIEELIWSMNTNNSQAPNYSTNHEYVLVYAKNRTIAEQDKAMFREPKPGFEEVMGLMASLNPKYPAISDIEKELKALYDRHKAEYREEVEAQGLEWEDEKGNDPWKGLFNYSNVEYRDADGNLVAEGDAEAKQARIWVWQEGDASMPATKQSPTTRDPEHANWRWYKPLHPKTGKPCPHPKSGWKFAYDDDADSPDKRSFVSLDRDARIAWGPDETKVPRIKRMLHEVETNVGKSVFSDYSDGEKQTSAMFGRSGVFLAPKHADFVSRFIQHAGRADSTILDCFGGSGSTAHAVIRLNRDDKGSRKFMLAEVGEYFDTVLKPRVIKALYSRDWRDGKPLSREGISSLVKVLRLESYEDALNNLVPRRTPRQDDLLASAEAQGADRLKEQYLLHYMLDVETRGSQSLLNVKAFADPTAYKLKVKRPGSDESREVNVDLLETLNWLIGLTVQGIAAPQAFTAEFERDTEGRLTIKGRLRQDAVGPWWFRTVTGTTPDGRRALIIWRKLTGNPEQDNLVLDTWFTRAGYSAKDSEFGLIYVNGDNNLENLKAADDTWKVRLIEEDFHRLMFDTEGL